MAEWLEWARGPAFRFAMLFLALGLARILVLQLVAVRRILRQAGNRQIPTKAVLRDTVQWLLPNARVPHGKRLLALVSVAFHVAVVVTPLFLAGHIVLWKRGLGIGWPALDQQVADILTWVGLAAALVLLAVRVFSRAARELSRPQDYLLLLLIGVIFGSGHLIVRPELNPFAYESTMLVHVLAGDLVLALMPFTKLSHAVLFPFERMSSEVYWRFPAGAGDQVADALHGKEPAVL